VGECEAALDLSVRGGLHFEICRTSKRMQCSVFAATHNVAQNIRFEQFHPALPCDGNTIILGSNAGTDPVGAGHFNNDQPP
jgi:hypothetical protein